MGEITPGMLFIKAKVLLITTVHQLAAEAMLKAVVPVAELVLQHQVLTVFLVHPVLCNHGL